ncbi:MAG: phosphohistidine phosphatase [Solirubrobacteraceae bacterium]|jgi:phosphohistidine phosphatase|nr:phosphohistidine phosphatase [Solirubrobacteraceae bacterium]
MARELWLLRHGEAEPHDARPDEERRLTPRGERQSRDAGAALARLGVELAAAYTSPRVRALDTARLACESLGVEPEVVEALSGGWDADGARELLAGHEDDDAILVVGHEPDLSQVVRDLVGGRVNLKKGGIATVRVDGARAELFVLLRPKETEAIAAA